MVLKYWPLKTSLCTELVKCVIQEKGANKFFKCLELTLYRNGIPGIK